MAPETVTVRVSVSYALRVLFCFCENTLQKQIHCNSIITNSIYCWKNTQNIKYFTFQYCFSFIHFSRLSVSFAVILNPSDFEFLLSKGETPKRNVSRDSILERFDPLSARKSIIHSIPTATRLPHTREENSPQTQHSAVINANHRPDERASFEAVVSTAPTDATIVKLDSPEPSIENSRATSESPTSSSSDTYVTASLDKPKSNSVSWNERWV